MADKLLKVIIIKDGKPVTAYLEIVVNDEDTFLAINTGNPSSPNECIWVSTSDIQEQFEMDEIE